MARQAARPVSFLQRLGAEAGALPEHNQNPQTGRKPPVSTTATVSPELEKATFAKISVKLIPFLFLCYIVAFLDRVNVGFAKLQMAGDLKFSDTVYSVGAGIFFVGYFIFEVPSNVILERVGARLWIARIMITWGIISSAFMYV